MDSVPETKGNSGLHLSGEIQQAAAALGTALADSLEMQELQQLAETDLDYERQQEVVKALFTRTAVRLSTTLGVKFTDFAR